MEIIEGHELDIAEIFSLLFQPFPFLNTQIYK